MCIRDRYMGNFEKEKSLYGKGLKPFVFSKKKNKFNQVDWIQDGDRVKYLKTEFPFLRFFPQLKNVVCYDLTFQYIPEYDDDQIIFASCIPYTYSDLLIHIQQLMHISKANEFENKQFKLTKLCKSLSGLDIPLLIITDYNSKIPLNQRKSIILTARIHPGETNSS
eukprot:TRINITY_DN17417_c0_g1_i1.p2 TRINITY_DN17417_c0_g1~~TRINITY_DN17417_c0_g1_i1.p2  ORF type:complete len:166 (+),score=26.72 TRINITY_DN17417_c0_g1_i1:53-550(+)